MRRNITPITHKQIGITINNSIVQFFHKYFEILELFLQMTWPWQDFKIMKSIYLRHEQTCSTYVFFNLWWIWAWQRFNFIFSNNSLPIRIYRRAATASHGLLCRTLVGQDLEHLILAFRRRDFFTEEESFSIKISEIKLITLKSNHRHSIKPIKLWNMPWISSHIFASVLAPA